MLSQWVARAVGDRFGPVRPVPLVIGGAYLLTSSYPTTSWVLVLASTGLFLSGGAWPFFVLLGECALLVASYPAPGSAGQLAANIMASVALFELAVRRPLWWTAGGAAALSTAYLVVVPHPWTFFGVLRVGHELVVGAAVPVLLGVCLRLGAQAVAQARTRTEERRELAVRDARQAERTEIARELHDLVAHHVASMALRVGIAREVVPDLDPRIDEVLSDVHTSAKTTLADLRRLVGVLRDPAASTDGTRSALVDPATLPAAVTAVVDRSAQAGLEVERHVDPAIATLDSVRGLAVLRLVQEGLTNVAKHAGAGARAAVLVEVLEDDVRVEVTDDGGAPDPRPRPLIPESGYGLVGLRERVALVGGTLTAGPHGAGWRLDATVPVVKNVKRSC